MIRLSVGENEAGMRLDRYLLRVLDRAPRAFVYKHLRKKNIKLNGSRALGSETLCGGDEVELYFSESTLSSLISDNAYAPYALLPPADIDIADFCGIVYEDEQIIIADKKAGVLSQKAKTEDVSLNEALRAYVGAAGRPVKSAGRGMDFMRRPEVGVSFDPLAYPGQPELSKLTRSPGAPQSLHMRPEVGASSFSPSVMNRLDRNASGLVTFARTYQAARELGRLFRNDAIEKYYLAIVEGTFDDQAGALDAWLVKDHAANTVRILDYEAEGSSRARTEYELLSTFSLSEGDASLIKVRLIGGKTHQIRASLSKLGHPILGDKKYLGTYSSAPHTLYLHACELKFPLDMGQALSKLSGKTVLSPLPERFEKILGIKGPDIN